MKNMEGLVLDFLHTSENGAQLAAQLVEQHAPAPRDVIHAVGLHVLQEAQVATDVDKASAEWLVKVAQAVKRNRNEPASPVAATKKSKSAFEPGSFLESLKAEPAQKPEIPLFHHHRNTQDHLDQCIAAAKPPLATPRDILTGTLAVGLYVRTTIELTGKAPRTKEVPKAQATRALALYDTLLVGAKMHRLRNVHPSSKKQVDLLCKHAEEIAAYLEDHPEEQRWWSNDEEERPTVQLQAIDGSTVESTDSKWLL